MLIHIGIFIYSLFCSIDLYKDILRYIEYQEKEREKSYSRCQQVFSQSSDSKYFGFVVCVTNTLLLGKSSHKQYINKWMWLYSNYILFIKVHSRLDFAHRLWFANSSTKESNNWGEKSDCPGSIGYL